MFYRDGNLVVLGRLRVLDRRAVRDGHEVEDVAELAELTQRNNRDEPVIAGPSQQRCRAFHVLAPPQMIEGWVTRR